MRKVKLINICNHMTLQSRLMIKIDHMIMLRTHVIQSSIRKFDIIHNLFNALILLCFHSVIHLY